MIFKRNITQGKINENKKALTIHNQSLNIKKETNKQTIGKCLGKKFS
jgi:hypothetical protein